MKRVVVRRTLHAPIERVFAALSAYEDYAGLSGVRGARVLRYGRSRRAGVGAIREMSTTMAVFREQITGYFPPYRLDYRIIGSQPRLDHGGASVQLEELGARTRVTWTTNLSVRLPALLGTVGTGIAAWQTRRGLRSLLAALEDRLAATAATPVTL
ncbi:MAG: SRPBCC family protein [Nevskiaceae bacterium]|nr:MAG: SRPBCC family protein [Nevskiaceae bacterium]TBR73077.1 MAG: SRPBCC family protein [Nevskiaceae bacterium]